MIIRARVVVTMNGPPIENGAVVVTGDRVIDVGKFSEMARTHSGEEVVDLSDRMLLPGLINAHCHLDYTGLRGKISRQKSFSDWIRSINAAKATLSASDYVSSISDGFAEAKRFGTTTVANLTAFPELVSQIESPIRTWWFGELIDVRDPSGANELVESAVDQLKSQPYWGLAPHAPYTASPNLYRRCENVAETKNVPLTTHLAESREEMEMFRDARGPLYDFLKDIGRDMSDCGSATPIARFAEIAGRGGSPNRPHLLVHLNEIGANDFSLIKKLAPSSSIVHCPRSHEYFGHSAFQFQKLRDIGCNICLGTDSLASNDDLSLFAEMRAFQKEFGNVPPEDIFKMVTVNSASAIGQGNSIGKIQPQFLADLIGIPSRNSKSVYEDIVAFDAGVDWSMGTGRVLA